PGPGLAHHAPAAGDRAGARGRPRAPHGGGGGRGRAGPGARGGPGHRLPQPERGGGHWGAAARARRPRAPPPPTHTPPTPPPPPPPPRVPEVRRAPRRVPRRRGQHGAPPIAAVRLPAREPRGALPGLLPPLPSNRAVAPGARRREGPRTVPPPSRLTLIGHIRGRAPSEE